MLHTLLVVAIWFFPDRMLRGDVSNDKFFGVFFDHLFRRALFSPPI
jgi:hypothetical protein